MASDPDVREPQVPRDAATMRLAHPLRVPASDPLLVKALPTVLGMHTWQALQAGLRSADELTANVVMDLSRDPLNFRLGALMQASGQLPGGSEVGHFYGSLMAIRQTVSPQPYFRVDDALCQLLLNTDLDDDIPVDLLKAPFPRFYVEFGTERTLPLHLVNDLSGAHVLEGAYVEYGTRRDVGRGFYVVFTASPLGKQDALDDATHNIFLRQDGSVTLTQAIDESYKVGTSYAQAHGLRTAGTDTIAPAKAALNFLAKVLLYLSLPDARRQLHPEKTRSLEEAARLKSTAKKNKAARRARALVDYILVTAPPPDAESSSSGPEDSTGRTLKTHWRRGHYRMQAHGPELSLRRLVFIRPVLVRADLGLTAGEHSLYRVA